MAVKHMVGIESANKIVQQAVDEAIGEGREIGLQVAAYLNGELAVDVWAGMADETTGRKVDQDTIFPTFSMAKPVTSVAVHIQAERGLIDYEKPVAHYWPEFGAHGKDKATVRNALGHRLGIPFMPEGVTVEQMCDHDWMCRALAEMEPVVEPGTIPSYMSYTFGWPLAELVRRTDQKRRPFAIFVQEEICQPLEIDGLWIGVPDSEAQRVAKLTNAAAPDEAGPLGPPGAKNHLKIPFEVGCRQEVFGRPEVRRACIPGANGMMTARSEARFFAMLAQGGELAGVRLLSQDLVRSFSEPAQPHRFEPDPTSMSTWPFLGSGGLKINDHTLVQLQGVLGSNPRTLWHDGAGGSVGWADPDAHLAVAICHNRIFYNKTADDNPFLPIAKAVRKALGVAN